MLYAEPRHVSDPAACLWYHTMDLPEIGTVYGHWDLRATIDEYLAHFDFQGLRCLDIGTASGALTWAMEARGAREVVSMELESGDQRDLVPFSGMDYAERRRIDRNNVARIQSGYWLAHRLLKSQAKAYYGTGYDLPTDLGHFDVAVLGMVLPHCRDPLAILEQAAARADVLLITQQAPQTPEAFAYWMPDTGRPDPLAWWSLSDVCLERMLNVLGFQVAKRVRAEHLRRIDGIYEPCTATVAERDRR
jgi:methyltransferase family protein